MKKNVLVFGVSDSEIPKYLEKVSESIDLTIITNDSICLLYTSDAADE